MGTRIEVMTKGSVDTASSGLISKSPIRVYNINDDGLKDGEIRAIEKLLADPIADAIATDSPLLSEIPQDGVVIEMSPKPGVNDPEGKTTKEAIERIIGRKIGNVSFAKQYLWVGGLSEGEYLNLQKKLGNPLVNEFRRVGYDGWDTKKGVGFHFPEVKLPKVEAFTYILDTKEGLVIDRSTTDEQLLKISEKRRLALNLEEMKTIRDLFNDSEYVAKRKEIGLEAMPTDAEVESLAQTWSEHCIHKKFNAIWEYTSDDPNDESGLPHITDSIFKSIIKNATEEISEDIDWLVSVFEDNSGVIKLNDKWNIAHKVETHNHPSGLDGFGGADTGTGGILRDPASTGTYMNPVSSQWGFRIPHPNSYPDLPLKIQSPARMFEGIVAGVEDYGNKMGIPTMCGQVMIDDGWLKPAVYVGCVAVAPAESNGKPTHIKEIRPGYIALSLGGGVGKDGIHGATGSSTHLAADAEQHEEINQEVQMGSPIVEKGVFEAMAILQKLGLIEASQDCGAGGWNSAVGELAGLLNELEEKRYEVKCAFKEKGITSDSSVEERFAAASPAINLEKKASPFNDTLKLEIASGEIFSGESIGKGGVVMDLTAVPEKYKGLAGWEKEVSEAQEREVLVIKPENLERALEICRHNNVEATKIAEFNSSGYYQVLDQNKTIAFLPIEFLHQGVPQMTIKAHWKPCENKEPEIPVSEYLTDSLLGMVERPNIQNYDWIMTRYDHEVQGGSLVKPLVGIGKGKSDAIAYRPVLGEKEVCIESWGSNPWHGDIDAYHMGRNNVVDALGRTVALGGNLKKITFNGNTTCSKPEKDPYVAAQVERMNKGAADAEIAFLTPRISGKDSTSMERDYKSTKTGKDVHAKAKTELLMSSLAIIPDDSTLTTCDFKLPGDVIYVVGDTRDELGGSEYYLMHDETGRNVPKSDFEEIKERYNALSEAIKEKLVHSAQYVAKGGLGVALANSAIAGDMGFDVDLDSIDEGLRRADKLLYSETTGRFVVTVHKSKKKEFEEKMHGCYVKEIGSVWEDEVCVRYKGKNVISTKVDALREKNKGEIRF